MKYKFDIVEDCFKVGELKGNVHAVSAVDISGDLIRILVIWIGNTLYPRNLRGE